MTTWIIIVLVALATFLLRASFIVFANPHRFPPLFRRALAFVPPAVLAAIIAPGLAMAQGALDLTLANPRWIAGLAAIAVATRVRHPIAPIAFGLPMLWCLQWLMG